MKQTFLLFILSLLFRPISAQPDISKVLSQENFVPADWISFIIKPAKWDVIKTVSVGLSSGKIYAYNNYNSCYRFYNDSVTCLPSFSYSLKTLPITYFPVQHTFYVTQQSLINGKTFTEPVPYRVTYLDSVYLVLEHIDFNHYDFETGKLLSDEEAEKMMADKEKKLRAEQPYAVFEIRSKRTGGESGRIVEVLQIK